MDSDALLRGGIQPDGLERAVSGKRDVERIVGAHESGHESRRRTVKDFLGRADLDDAPGVDDGDAVGQCQRFLPVVRHIHRSDSDSLLQCAELVAQLEAHLVIEIRHRLVEQQQARIDRKRAAQGDALPLSA